MSSKVLPSGHDVPFERFAWMEVTGGQAEDRAGPGTNRLEERLRDAERACEQRVREARAAGMREGEAAGRERTAAEWQAAIERAVRSVDELAGLRARLRREAEADLVRLSLAIARRILHREIAVDPDAMRGVVLAALEKVQAQEIARVRVHPEQAPMLREILQRVASQQPIEVVADTARERGALVIETSRGNLDASVETQLQEIERGLTDRLQRS